MAAPEFGSAIFLMDDVVCTGSENRLIDCRYASEANCLWYEAVGLSCLTGGNRVPIGEPTITGTLRVGQTLSADTSSIVDRDGPASPSFSYQWLADEEEIAGATGATYTLTAAEQGKRITVRVSYTDGGGTEETLTSAATKAVNHVPSGEPTIVGTAQVWDTLRADVDGIMDGDGVGRPIRFQWLADDAVIAGATSYRYTLTAAEQGKRITVRVSYTDGAGYRETLTSAATEAVAAADTQLAGSLRLRDGVAAASGRLEVYLGGRWGDVCDDGFGAEEGAVACRQLGYSGFAKRMVAPEFGSGIFLMDDVVCTGSENRLIDCRYASAANCLWYEAVGLSCLTGVNRLPTGEPTITGTAQVGQTLSADPWSIEDLDGPARLSFSYQWLADEEAIAGATGVRYTLTLAEQGTVIQVRVSYTDGGGTEETLTSAATEAVAAADPQDEPEVLVYFGAERYTAAEGGAAAMVTVRLTTAPGREVTIPLTAAPGGGATAADYTVPAQVSFGSEETLQRFTVTATDDRVDDDGETVELRFGELPPRVTASTPQTATVSIADDDTAGVAVSAGALTVPEGGSRTYRVVLESEPEGEVTVRVTVAAGTDVTVSPQRLTFEHDWSEPYEVTVSAAEDADAVADVVVTVSHEVSGYGAVTSAADVLVTIQENDTAGVAVSAAALSVPEGGRGSYTVALESEPAATVTVTAAVPAGTDVAVSPQRLTFTADDWSEPREVTVNAAEDADAVADAVVTVSHAVSGYGAVSTAAAVLVTIQENDTAGVAVSAAALSVPEGGRGSYTVALESEPAATVTVTAAVPEGADVTVSPQRLTFTADDWSEPREVTVRAAEDADAVADAVVTVSHAVSGYGTVSTAADVRVTVQENDTAAVAMTPTGLTVLEGGSGSYAVVLESEPAATVTVTAAVPAGTDVTVSPQRLTFTADDWSEPQAVTVRAAEDADAVADAVVTVSHEVSGYGAVTTAADVAVTIQENDTAGVVVTPTALTVPEGGRGSYTVALVTQPDGTVTVTAAVPAETALTVSPERLTFTADDWSEPQEVTLQAAEDADADVEAVVTVSHAVSGYGAVTTAAAVAVAIAELDTAGVAVTPTGLTVPEGGRGSYTVVLESEPRGEVTVTAAVSAGTDVTVSPQRLTFTAGDWSEPQAVTVSAAEDADAVADADVTVSHAVSGYGAVSAAAAVAVTVQENDTPGVAVSPTALRVPEGGRGSYTVVLATQPAGTVTVTAAVSAGTDVTVSPESLTFTAGDWSEPQAVTVQAAEDADAVADAVVRVSHAVSGYGAVSTAAAVAVTIQENDTAGVAVSPTALRVPEGGRGSYTVVLATQPAGTVTVTTAVPAGTDVEVSPEHLTFTASDWSSPQEVTVSAAEDADAVTDAEVTISHAVSGYGAVSAAAAVRVTIAENDTAEVPAEVPAAVTVDVRAADATVTFPTNAKFTVALEFTAPVTGLALEEIEVTNGVAAQLSGGGASYTVEVTPVADFEGVTTVAIGAGAAQDGAGTGNDAASAEFAVDTRAPTAASTTTAPVDTGAGTTTGGVEYAEQSGSRTSARTDNNPATGQIDIRGKPKVDSALLAHPRDIADADGLPPVISWSELYYYNVWLPYHLFSVQWIAGDREIAAGTALMYRLTDAEAGKRISVRLSFTDDLGNEETITSAATAAVQATPDTSSSFGDLRLLDGTSNHGRLEIFKGGRWGTVCDDGFGHEEEAVACRQLGYRSAVGFAREYEVLFDPGNPNALYFSSGPRYPVFLDDTDCTGSEARLTDCEYRKPVGNYHYCGRIENVILQCSSAALAAPSFTSSATFSVRENETAVGTVTTARVSGPLASYAIADGDDGALFAIGEATGELSFTSGRDFENPTDVPVPDPNDPLSDVEYSPSSDNVYVVVVTAARGYGDGRVTAEQTVSVTVTDVDEPAPAPVAVTVAVESPTSLRVSWQVPDNSGRPAITDYDVRYRVAGSDTFSDAEHVGTGLSMTLTNLIANTTYEVQVRASNDEGAGPWSPAVRWTTGANQLPSGAPAITGTAQVGQTLSADTSSIVDRDGPERPSFSYQWLADDEEIAGATGATYTLTAAEQGKRITVRVTFTDGAGNEEALTSAATAAVAVTAVQVHFGAARYTAVEGGAAAVVTVRLSTEPEREVTIPLTAAPGGGATAADYTVPEQVSFGGEETLQRLTVTATDDGVDDDGETVAVGFGELPPGVTARTPRTATVSIVDDDTAGVAVSPWALSVPEGGRGSYAVALESEPEGEVTVTAAVPAGTDVTVSPQRLTFTADDWSEPQAVEVSAAEDADAVADAVVVSHAVSGYGAVSTAAAVLVIIQENDTAGVAVSAGALSVPEGGRGSYAVALESEPAGTVTVTAAVSAGTDVAVSPQRLTFTADDWSSPQTVTVRAAEDADAVADAVVTVSHAVSGYGAVSTAADVLVTILENDTAGVAVSAGALSVPEGGRGSYTVVLESEPAGTVTVTATVPAGTDVTVSPQRLTFTAGTWSSPQEVTVRAAEDADAVVDAVVTVSHAVSGYGAVSTAAAVRVTILENDTGGVAVSAGALSVPEGGRRSYAVVLESEPAGTVTVTATVPAGTDVAVSPQRLTFTADTWSEPQEVTVRAAEDADAVADAVVRVSHAVSGYGAVSAAADVRVTVQENDTAAVAVTPTGLTVLEGGRGSYAVVLESEPAATVTVTASVPAGTDVTVSPQRLTFTADDWSEPQEVTVRAAEDADAVADAVVRVSHAVSGYGAVSTAADVAVTVQENGTAGVVVTPTALTVPEGGRGSYTVALVTQPDGTVTVTASVPEGTDVEVSPQRLTFTADTWSEPQEVTVRAAEDADADVEAEVTVSHAVNGYGAVSVAAAVAVTVQELDTAGVAVSPTGLTVPEGGRGSYTVVLESEPVGTVTVAATVSAGTDVEVSPESLTFTADTWSSPQTVTVSAAEDADAVADAEVTVSHAVSGYGEVSAAADVAVTVQENDTAGVVVTPTALTVPEGGRGSYTVVLVTQPDGTVTVTATVPEGTDVEVSPQRLTFTADTWSEPQEVTVRAAEDADADVEAEVTVSHAVSGYGAVSVAAAVAVTVQELDTAGVAVSPTGLTVPEAAAGATRWCWRRGLPAR